MNDDTAASQVHEAVNCYLEQGELAVAWCLVIDIAGPDNVRYLAHRAGGGHDGTDRPVAWTALGMLRASTQAAEDQLRQGTVDYDDDDEP